MRVLHLVKTADGAGWAAQQVSALVALGIDIHVAVPGLHGRVIPAWRSSGAVLHEIETGFPAGRPWRLPLLAKGLRDLVSAIGPDLVHSHFVSTTVLMRLALGRSHTVKRIFQVPGPLHLENPVTRVAEISLAGPSDYWVGSSQYVCNLYKGAGTQPGRLFLSYYGGDFTGFGSVRTGTLRARLGIGPHEKVVGNINHFYPPKWYLGHRVGIKRPELLIDALSLIMAEAPLVRGVLVGGQWGGAGRYVERVRRRAARLTRDRVILPGPMAGEEVAAIWPDFDLAVHVPLSENCGGVVEPILCGVPVIASRTGGLPEVVRQGETGLLLDDARPEPLAEAILDVLRNPEKYRASETARQQVRLMFDVRRTAAEIYRIYRHLLLGEPAPPVFHPW